MNFNYLWILLWFYIIPKTLSDDKHLRTSQPMQIDKFKVHFLEPNNTFRFKPAKRGFFEKHLNTYCYRGEAKTLGRVLESIELQLDIEGDDYTQYDGKTPKEVEEHYSEHRSLFSLNLFSQKRSRLSLSPFMQQCIGIETIRAYNVTLHQENVNYWRTVQLLSGIGMFLFAGILSTNSLFYYITGILLGICSSFLLLIWLSGKLMPKRTMMYGFLIGGGTVGFYIIRVLWDNIQMIMMTYRNYVLWYIGVTGIISFLVCYRYGPPKNRRSKNIIKWLLQLMSVVMIYFSSNFKEASAAIIIMIALLYYFPRVLKRLMSFRGQARASNEYSNYKRDKRESGATRVKELRDDCKLWRTNSPQQNEWKINSKSRPPSLKNISGMDGRLTPTYMNDKKDLENSKNNTEDIVSGSDISWGEHDVTKQKLYPLPDGSFILSEKPPIIITPRQTALPIYHRSTPIFANDEHDEGDYTPKNHHAYVPLAAHARRLGAAASTSDLLRASGRRATPSPSQLQRSTSVQRDQSRSSRMKETFKKVHGSNPRIKVEKPTSSDDESDE